MFCGVPRALGGCGDGTKVSSIKCFQLAFVGPVFTTCVQQYQMSTKDVTYDAFMTTIYLFAVPAQKYIFAVPTQKYLHWYLLRKNTSEKLVPQKKKILIYPTKDQGLGSTRKNLLLANSKLLPRYAVQLPKVLKFFKILILHYLPECRLSGSQFVDNE